MMTTVNVTVTAYIAPSFALTNGGAITISAPGATTGNTTSITVMPSGGFTGNVTLTAALTSSPSGAIDPPTFSFGATSPVNITGASNGTGTLSVTTTAATTGALVSPNPSQSSLVRGRRHGSGLLVVLRNSGAAAALAVGGSECSCCLRSWLADSSVAAARARGGGLPAIPEPRQEPTPSPSPALQDRSCKQPRSPSR